MRPIAPVILVFLLGATFSGCQEDAAGPVPAADATKKPIARPVDADAGDSPVDARLFVKAYEIDEVREEFPIKAGMSVAEVEALVRRQESFASETDLDDIYNLGWEKRDIRDGDGWMYFWVNGKHLLHCDLVVEEDRVKSVWVMPGNEEWAAWVYVRLSGTGRHGVEGRTAADPSRIESDAQLAAAGEAASHVDSLWLHSDRVTDDGLRHLRGLTGLRELNLGTVELTDSGLAHVAEPEGLEELRFWHNTGVTDAGLRQLRSLRKLRRREPRG